jgi:hypothetical protein
MNIKSPDSKSSPATRKLTDAAKALWGEFLSNGKRMIIVNDNRFIDARINHLRANLSEAEPLSGSAAADLERWNIIAEEVDAAQHVVHDPLGVRSSCSTVESV